jgi:hypothetical protein
MTYTSGFLIYNFFQPQSLVKQCPRMALINMQDCYNVYFSINPRTELLSNILFHISGATCPHDL